MKKFLIALFALTSLVLPISANAQSLDAAGISISPVVFELNADPGDTIANQLKVYNPTSSPMQVMVDINDFKPIGEQGEVTLVDPELDTSAFSLSAWTSVAPQQFTLEAKEQEIVTFVIKVPSDAEPGGHYGSVAPRIVASSGEQISGSSTATKAGALILLNVSGSISEELAIDSFSAPEVSSYGPIPFSIRYLNTGNVHVKPTGFITISDILGNKVAEVEVKGRTVLPGVPRVAEVSWGATDLFGRYNATLVVSYGNTSKKTLTANYAFSVIPWGRVVAGSVILLSVLVILVVGRKRIGTALKVLLHGQ